MQNQGQILARPLPKTYFQLIQLVNSSGRYQFFMLLIFCGVWYVTGIILMSTGFLYLNNTFNCQDNGLLTTGCANAVCKLPKQQWDMFLQQKEISSIATDFDKYYCEDQIYVDLASSMTYFGTFVGYVLSAFFTDNLGRKKSILIAWAVATLGTIVLVCSQNLIMAAIGLFLAGAGSDAAINICFYFFGEIVEDNKRQKYSIIIQILFSMGAISVTILFYLLPNWKIVMIASVTIPSIIILALITFYIEQTPQFLIRQGTLKALKSLNRIGKINQGIDNLVSQQDILSVMEEQVQQKQFQKFITPIDLIRFPSLRAITICSCLVSFFIYAMYYGPVLIINEIGFDIYISSLIVQGSELVSFIPGYFLIVKLPRRKSGFVAFTITLVTAGVLIFIQKPEDCNLCVESIIELALIFVFRFAISIYFAMFLVYTVELYPARARGLGNGVVSAVGTISSTVSPILLGILRRNQLNVMIVFTMLSLLGMGLLSFLPESLGVPLKDQIQEIAMEKNKRKTILSPRRQQKSSLIKSLDSKNINISNYLVKSTID